MSDSPASALRQLVSETRAAETQTDYEAAADAFFLEIEAINARLHESRYLHGAERERDDDELLDVLVDVVLVYSALYKLNKVRILDLPELGPYLLDLYQAREAELGAAEMEADVERRLREGWTSDDRWNPKGIVPAGRPDFRAPHDRHRFDRDALRDLGAAGAQDNATSRRARGEFVRGVSAHRDIIGRDVPAESGRYHLLLANNCPWCHRVALARELKRLDDVISVGVLYYRRDPERGWRFAPEEEGFDADALYGHDYVTDYYARVGSTEKSVPLLWDKEEGRPVNNESSEIVRMFDEAWPERGLRLVPPTLRDEIDDLNAWIYRDINNGAYKAGFSSHQEVYERAFGRFFRALDRLERILADRRFLCGDEPTEADLRLYPTLFRFDPVYFNRMKLNARMLRDYRHLPRWLADFGALPGVAEASNIEHCRRGYFGRTAEGFIPIGPAP